MSYRSSQIKAILKDLESIRNGVVSDSEKYGIEENIIFFNALKSPLSYCGWLLGQALRIDRKRLLELSDFPLPRWQEELHVRLVEMEKKAFPGMITPLRDAMVDFILEKNPRYVMDFGGGGMEVELQVIHKLIDVGYTSKICFISVDLSSTVHEVAKTNLKDLIGSTADLYEEKTLTQARLNKMVTESAHQYQVILCCNDIFTLPEVFDVGSIDLVFYSKFRHHFTEEGKVRLDVASAKIAKVLMEFDDYWSWPLLIPQSIAAWKYPVLLNGAVFSRLRDPSKKELSLLKKKGENVSFFGIGSYLRMRRFG